MDPIFDCSELDDHLDEYLDIDAAAAVRRAIETHMRACPRCRGRVDSVRRTILLYQAEGVSEMPITVTSRLRSALARAYDHPPV